MIANHLTNKQVVFSSYYVTVGCYWTKFPNAGNINTFFVEGEVQFIPCPLCTESYFIILACWVSTRDVPKQMVSFWNASLPLLEYMCVWWVQWTVDATWRSISCPCRRSLQNIMQFLLFYSFYICCIVFIIPAFVSSSFSTIPYMLFTIYYRSIRRSTVNTRR